MAVSDPPSSSWMLHGSSLPPRPSRVRSPLAASVAQPPAASTLTEPPSLDLPPRQPQQHAPDAATAAPQAPPQAAAAPRMVRNSFTDSDLYATGVRLAKGTSIAASGRAAGPSTPTAFRQQVGLERLSDGPERGGSGLADSDEGDARVWSKRVIRGGRRSQAHGSGSASPAGSYRLDSLSGSLNGSRHASGPASPRPDHEAPCASAVEPPAQFAKPSAAFELDSLERPPMPDALKGARGGRGADA